MKVKEIVPNPDNPRLIRDEKFEKLKDSIKEFPEMLELRPIVIDENNMILGGNMRYHACLDLGIKDVPVKVAEGLTEDQKKEFIIKDNVSFGLWDFDILGNEWDQDLLEKWGVDLPLEDEIDEMEEEDEIELEQSVQLEPPKEYVLIMCEPNSVEWEQLKEMLKLKMVRRGGYKKGSVFDAVGLERVLWYDEFIKRLRDVDSSSE